MGLVGVSAATVAAATVASTAYSMSQGSPSGGAFGTQGGNPATYIPQGQGQADTNYQNITNQQYPTTTAVPGQVDPIYLQALQNMQSNPYSASAQAGANAAGVYGTGTLAPQQIGAASNLSNAGNQVLGNAFDPQNALYNQTAQNVQGQSAVANAQSGVQGPAAAGITDNNLNNFNMGWQNNQLSREQQGVSAAGQAYSGGSQLGGSALQNLTTSSQLPYATYTGQQNDMSTAANTYASGISAGNAPESQLANLLQSYLGMGQSATKIAQNGQQLGNTQNTLVGSQLGGALNSLANNQGLSNLFSNNSSSNSYSGGTAIPSSVDAYGSVAGFGGSLG